MTGVDLVAGIDTQSDPAQHNTRRLKIFFEKNHIGFDHSRAELHVERFEIVQKLVVEYDAMIRRMRKDKSLTSY